MVKGWLRRAAMCASAQREDPISAGHPVDMILRRFNLTQSHVRNYNLEEHFSKGLKRWLLYNSEVKS
jgi:hypothetical protein